MVAQKSAFESSMAQIEELEALLQERITRLEQQAGLRQRQLALLNEELENAASLVERGLSTVARESNLQRAVTDQQVRLLEVETARLTAQQQLNETRRDRLDLTNERDRERVQGVQDQRAAIAELSVRMETEAALFAESTQIGNRTGRSVRSNDPGPADHQNRPTGNRNLCRQPRRPGSRRRCG